MTGAAIDMGSVRRVLIVKMSAMGDVIHALPVSAAMGEAFPHIEITWAVEDIYAPILEGNPYLSHVLKLPKVRSRDLRSVSFHRTYLRHLRDVRRRQFDLTLDLQGLTKSAVVAAASGARFRLAYHWLREAAGLLERPIAPRKESVHIVEQYLDVARFLGANVERVAFPFHIPSADDASSLELLRAEGIDPDRPFATVNPAAGAPLKQWGARRFAELMDSVGSRLGIQTALVTADSAVSGEVARMAKRPFANLAGRTSLKQLAAVIRRSAIHVCGDTGSGHLAAALGVPVVSLIGPTDPDRACPYGFRRSTITGHNLCGPRCTGHHCRLPEPRCMTTITVDSVLGAMSQLMQTA